MNLPKRYKPYGVGKYIGGNVYIHRDYKELLPQDEFQRAEELVPPNLDGLEYNLIKFNLKTRAFTFIWCYDFDTAHEPTMGISIILTPDTSKVISGFRIRPLFPPDDPWIYHHKWLMVKDDYRGFDVAASRARSECWMKLDIDKTRIGKKSYWEKNVIPLLNL